MGLAGKYRPFILYKRRLEYRRAENPSPRPRMAPTFKFRGMEMGEMKIISYITRNFIKMLILIILTCIVTFILVVNSPIDPIREYVGTEAITEEQREAIREYWGLNDTKIERFIKWSSNFLRGDLGRSIIFRRNV